MVAAPICEEYLFRGLLFRGLRRSTSLPVAVLASAMVFMLVHPPFSWAPVFVLGVATALATEGSGAMYAGIVIHLTYNAFILWLNGAM